MNAPVTIARSDERSAALAGAACQALDVCAQNERAESIFFLLTRHSTAEVMTGLGNGDLDCHEALDVAVRTTSALARFARMVEDCATLVRDDHDVTAGGLRNLSDALMLPASAATEQVPDSVFFWRLYAVMLVAFESDEAELCELVATNIKHAAGRARAGRIALTLVRRACRAVLASLGGGR